MSMKHKYMDIHDLSIIELSLNNGDSFKHIPSLINKDCTTISKYVRRNLTIKNSGAYVAFSMSALFITIVNIPFFVFPPS